MTRATQRSLPVMPLSTSDVLDAYRADLSNAGKGQFSDRDGAWLELGTLLQRAVTLPRDARGAYLQSAARAIRESWVTTPAAAALATLAKDGASPGALCDVVMIIAGEAEEAGACALATTMIDSTRSLVGLSEFRLQGRLLARQARILRKIGEIDPAIDLYDEVGEMGRTHGDRELIARSHLGKGALARERGNYPEARREFLAVLEAPGSSDAVRELHAHAHHGLLIASAIAKDFDTALTHGALAVDGAADEQHRVELLQNLSSVCYDVGEFRSALNGYLQALAATQVERVRLGCFGGAAVAAARLGETRTVDALVRAATPLLTQRSHAFELADMSREFAEAYAYLGDVERVDHYRADALNRAHRGKFFEIVHRIESMHVPSSPVQTERPAYAPLTGDARAVTAHLASGDSVELLAAAVSTGRAELNSH